VEEYTLQVSGDSSGKRLDICLLEFFKNKSLGLSRTAIQKLISSGKVQVNRSACLKTNYKVKSGDTIGVTIEEKKDDTLRGEDIPLEIVYEDDSIAVVNKQAGLVVHPAPGNYEHTLVNALLVRVKKLSDVNPSRPGIVHRLDKETSGLLVVAKNNVAHQELARQFSEHSIKRKYLALVRGEMEFDEGVIELPIQRHPRKRKNMSVGFSPGAKYARTYYRTLKRSDEYSVLELEPFTGRTHQLRVHLSSQGHPILGDDKYGRASEFPRLALHAKYLGFVHPATGKFIEFDSELPPEFKDFIGKI